MDAQIDADALAQACPDCKAEPGTGCSDWSRLVSYMHAVRYQAIPG